MKLIQNMKCYVEVQKRLEYNI